MRTIDAQLWGGPQDGLRAKVKAGEFTGPPSFVDVPEAMYGGPPIVLMPRTEAEGALDDVVTVRYRLVPRPPGTQVIYRLDREEEA